MYDVTVLFAIVATALARGRRLTFALPDRARIALEHPLLLPLALAVLVAAQHAYLALMVDASLHQSPALELFGREPVRIVSDTGGPKHIATSYGDRFALLAIVESLALALVYHATFRTRRWQIAAIVITTLAMCADAIFVRAGTSSDMYSYVGFTLLGTHAYAPPAISFPGEYSVINSWWGTPLVPAPYGPLWLAIAHAAAALASTLFAKILAFRMLGVVALLGVVAMLAAMRFPARIVALIALNPALLLEFVANVHNDLFAVALLLGARLAATRGALLLAVVATVLAGLVKLPFVLFAALAFVPIGSRRRRVLAYCAAVVIAFGVSWLWGGAAYVAALGHHVGEHTAGNALTMLTDPSIFLKVAAVVGIAMAFLSGTWLECFAWTLPAVGAAFYPWYLSWTLPYAVASRDMLRNVAIALPLVTFVTDPALGNGTIAIVLQVGTYALLTIAIAWQLIDLRRNFAASGRRIREAS